MASRSAPTLVRGFSDRIGDRTKQTRDHVEPPSQAKCDQRPSMKANARTAFARDGQHLTARVQTLDVEPVAQMRQMPARATSDVKQSAGFWRHTSQNLHERAARLSIVLGTEQRVVNGGGPTIRRRHGRSRVAIRGGDEMNSPSRYAGKYDVLFVARSPESLSYAPCWRTRPQRNA